MEEFRDIEGFEGLYKVSNFGNVLSLYTNKILTPRIQRGYYKVNLYKGGKCSTKQIHRLVALAFIDNPNELPYVNHIDEDKVNNHIDNLEWISHVDNVNHGTGIDRMKEKLMKSVEQYSKSGELIATYDSINEASKAVNGSAGNISSVITGRRKTAYGYVWKLID